MWRLLCLSIVVQLAACANTTKISNINDICQIFAEKKSWEKWARRAHSEYGTTVPIAMAIMRQESSFVATARPPKTKVLGIPLYHKSSAYGFAQAKKSTWKWYREKVGKSAGKRTSFKNAIYFIGWYNTRSLMRNGIKLNDPRNLYLAYHEGQSGYASGSYRKKKWLLGVADKVAKQSKKYRNQYRNCS